ncbi:protein ROOT PRIMORDIUM DEFECTIVE 1 [Hordeum vulgare]|nr:protein ROOT PRIMORDIUM DEFECTIVE 1 [Hordeum vulgare]
MLSSGDPLDASNVFTFIATLRLVQDPIRAIPEVLGVVVQAKVAFTRIEKFLGAPELNGRAMEKCSSVGTGYLVAMNSCGFSWVRRSIKTYLKDISLVVNAGEKVAICGEIVYVENEFIRQIVLAPPDDPSTPGYTRPYLCPLTLMLFTNARPFLSIPSGLQPRLAPPLLTDVRRRSPPQRRRPFAAPLSHRTPAPPRSTPPHRRSPPLRPVVRTDRLIDRPRRFPHLPLRRGLNLRRAHRDYLLRFHSLPEASPFEPLEEGASAETTERRACAVVREVLEMTVEKRTLVYHLTHFRRDFGLPNRLRALLVHHLELVLREHQGRAAFGFLVEAFDDSRRLLVEDGMLVGRDRLEDIIFRKDFRTQCQFGNNGFYGVNYIQVLPADPFDHGCNWTNCKHWTGFTQYVQKVSEKVSLATDFMYNHMSKDVTASVGYDYIMRQSRLRGEGRYQWHNFRSFGGENQPTRYLVLSAEVDHWKKDNKFGIGINVGECGSEAGQTVYCDANKEHVIHFSQVALGETEKGSVSTLVTVKIGDQKVVIGTLSAESHPQIPYDLIFEKRFELSHSSKTASVFACGYKVRMPICESDSSEDEDEVETVNNRVINPIVDNVVKLPTPTTKDDKKVADNPDSDEDDSDTCTDSDDVLRPTDDEYGSSGDDTDSEEDGTGREEMDTSSEEDSTDEEDKDSTKPEGGNKRAAETELKAPASDKKAKIETPSGQDTDDKKAVHVATPHPAKQAGKQNGKSTKYVGGSHACKSCSRTFGSDSALKSMRRPSTLELLLVTRCCCC